MSASELTEALERYSPTPLPSALAVLIQDAARHHGAVRVREVACLLRVADPAVAAGLVADTQLAELELDEVAPGILTSTAPAGQVLRVLRVSGGAPVLEDAHGALLLAADQLPRWRGHLAPEAARPGSDGPVRRRRPSPRDLAVLVGRMRAGEQARIDSGQGRRSHGPGARPGAAASGPGLALAATPASGGTGRKRPGAARAGARGGARQGAAGRRRA